MGDISGSIPPGKETKPREDTTVDVDAEIQKPKSVSWRVCGIAKVRNNPNEFETAILETVQKIELRIITITSNFPFK